MMWLRKSKKGFTLIELMVVVAIIAILALLGLRLFLRQQIKAKNAIVKANAATVHTIIQGNLADETFDNASDAVDAICKADGVSTLSGGTGDNIDRPAGMKNPHLTGDVAPADLVVSKFASGTGYATDILFKAAIVTAAPSAVTYAGVVLVGEGDVANKFYIVGLDNDTTVLGEVYVAQK